MGVWVILCLFLSVVACALSIYMFCARSTKKEIVSPHVSTERHFIYDPSYEGVQPNVYRDFSKLYERLHQTHGSKNLEFVFHPHQLELDIPAGLYNMMNVTWVTRGHGVKTPKSIHKCVLNLLDGTKFSKLDHIRGPMVICNWNQHDHVMVRDRQNTITKQQAADSLLLDEGVELENRGTFPMLYVAAGNKMTVQLRNHATLVSCPPTKTPTLHVASKEGVTLLLEDSSVTVGTNSISTETHANLLWKGTGCQTHYASQEHLPNARIYS